MPSGTQISPNDDTNTRNQWNERARTFENFTEMMQNIMKNTSKNAYSYDQIVGYGELWSTTILSHFIRASGVENKWLDARKLIKTSAHFQEARVSWSNSKELIKAEIKNNPPLPYFI